MSQSDDINDPRNPNSPFNLSNVNSPFYNPGRAAAQSGAGIVLGVLGLIGVIFYWVFVFIPFACLLWIFQLFFVDDIAIPCTLVVSVGLYIKLMLWACRKDQKKIKTDEV